MEPFIVSARKYRPETFEDVVGQGAITKTLENAIASNHLAQALLFTGPRGVGKTTCARILAKKINQQDGLTDPDEDFAFNIFELDAASNNSVDDIRSLIEQVRIPPQVGRFKVYIIDEVHMLSQAAFNAFLKTLEEPPAHAIFILATTEKHKIIPTILSRCQIFDFKRISVSDMREHLKRIAVKEGITAEDEALQIIAQKADGALRDSLSIFDRVVSFSGNQLTVQAVTENLNVLDRETYFKMTDLILQHNIPQLLVHYDVIMSKGFDGHHFIAGIASHFRDLMVCKDQRTIHLLELAESTKSRYADQSSRTEMAFLREAIEIANNTDLSYRNSRNPRLLVELCLMQLASIGMDGEKKKEYNFIIPAEQFTAQPVSVVSESITETPAPTPAAAVPSEVVVTAAIDAPQSEPIPEVSTQSGNLKDTEPIAEKANDSEPKEMPLEIHQVNSINQNEMRGDFPVDTPEEIEQKRKALLAKSKKQISGLSISSIQAKKEHVNTVAQKKVDTTQLPNDDFDEEAAQKAWSTYAAHLRNRGSLILASIMEADVPKLKDKVLLLRFPNQSMKEDLEKEKGRVLEHIRRTLNNYDVDFAVTVDKTVAKKYVFTDHEKYETLVTKNKAIELLRKEFDLEL